MELRIVKNDPSLQPFAGDIQLRMDNYAATKERILPPDMTLAEYANGHHYFGFHRCNEGWYYREWAPAAEAM